MYTRDFRATRGRPETTPLICATTVSASCSGDSIMTLEEPSFGPQGRRQAVQQFQKLSPHVLDLLWSPVLERLERTVEAESTRPGERPKHDCQGVEISGSTEK